MDTNMITQFISWGVTMKNHPFPAVAAALCVVFVEASSAQNLLQNPDFESASVLLPGQSEVSPGGLKALFQTTAVPRFSSGINAVPNWQNSFSNVGYGAGFRDAGISRVGFSGSGTSRYAYINNWETRLSQTVAATVRPGVTYQATIRVGMDGNGKGGRFQLWAGSPLSANPDLFPSTAVNLAEVKVASVGWTLFTPDVRVPLNVWTTLTINYTAPSTGAMLGQPLTVSFITNQGSVGPIFWDDATLVPSPGSASMLLVATVWCRRRRR